MRKNAFPVVSEEGIISHGLSRREYFAAVIVNGQLASSEEGIGNIGRFAKYVVELTDEILDQLDRTDLE